jgi:LysW-gamma-L-lysine carboxypeptidase
MDTVPGDIPVRRRGNLLYGRGTVDAKGPLATFILATARVAPSLENTCITVIGAVEEEAYSKGAHHLAKTMDAPGFCIIGEPSDWDCVTIGYKGRLCVEYTWQQPDSHSAGAQVGAAEKAITFWNQLVDYADQRNHGQEGRFDTLDPGLRDFQTTSDGLATTVQMTIAMRLPPDFKPGVLKRKMKGWAEGATLEYLPLDMPYQSGKNNHLVRAMLKGIRAEGGRPRFKLKTGTSDMNTVGPVWQCPIVAYGPGDSALDHTPEEHIDVKEYERAIDVLAQALKILDT